MHNPIIVLGTGRSATVLLQYLDQLAQEDGFRFTVADADQEILQSKVSHLRNADPVVFNALEISDLVNLIGGHRIVISLLPPPFHPQVGKSCLISNSNLVTASYESPEMRALAKEVEEKGLIFLNECGLDPGIDHMSAMEIIEGIKSKGGKITSFYSYCGGLVADAYDDNPFKYKISWNPRNVALAGKGVSKFIDHGRISLLPYHRLFRNPDHITVKDWGNFEGYANRDSEPYSRLYGLPEIKSLKRGTLRKPGFCSRWNSFVQLGLTDDQTQLSFGPDQTYADLMAVFLPEFNSNPGRSLKEFCGDDEIASDILKMGFGPGFERKLERINGTPADFLVDLIVGSWALKPADKDLVVMVHLFEFELEGIEYQTISSFGLEGTDAINTAMATTVGLPLGIIAKRLLHNQINQKGLLLPLQDNIYRPVLKELSSFGIHFQTFTKPI